MHFPLFQTGCSPASAFASFSKQPSSPPKDDRTSRSTSGLMHSLPDTLASNIPTFPRSVSPASYSPPASPLEGDVVIPCEFCGVALEEAVVFHHQVFHSSNYLANTKLPHHDDCQELYVLPLKMSSTACVCIVFLFF